MLKKGLFTVIVCLLGYVNLALAQWNRNYIGVNYLGFPTSIAEINADLALLAPRFGYIRTYNSLFGPTSPENQVVPLVYAFNQAHPATPIKVAIGVALTPGNPTQSQTELNQAIHNAKTYPSAVSAVVVGNENLGNISEADLIGYMTYAKNQLKGTPVEVTTCQTWGVLFGHPNLVQAASSYVLANIYPYWDGPGYSGGTAAKAGADTLKNWQARFLSDYNQLVNKYGAAKIRIGETGWPSAGSQVQIQGVWTGVPSQTAAYPNEQTYVEQYVRWAGTNHLFTYLFAAIDEGWKQEPGGVGPHWGLYTASRTPKWTLGQLPAVNPGTTLYLGTDSPYETLAFNGGTLLIIDPQATWGNGFDITAGTTSTLDNAGNSLLHTGPLSGSGNLVHTGTGTAIHQGDGSGFSGTYTIEAGTLNLANNLGATGTPCTVVVNPGGTLAGAGPLVGSLSNHGKVNPGNSPGTLNIVGSYTQTAAGTCTVEVASLASFDRISVSSTPGTATLAGTVAPTLTGGFRPLGNQVFPGIITTTGGVTGSFGSIANQQITPTLFWQARYHPASVDLWVQRQYNNSGLGLNDNQQAVGVMLNRLAGVTSGDLNTVLNTIDNLPFSAGVQDAFQQFSPEKSSTLSTLALAGATLQMRQLARQIIDLRFGSRETGSWGGLPGSFNLNYSREAGLMLAYNSSSLAGLITTKPRPVPESRWGIYLEPFLVLGRQQASVNQTGFSFTMAGFTAGADYRVWEDLLVGLATGYSYTGAGFYGSGGGVQTNTWPLTAYAAYLPGSFYAFGSLGYALNLFTLERGLNFGGLNRTAKSSPAGHQLNVYGEAGYDLQARSLVVTPLVSLAYSGLWVDSFTENGAGSMNLKVSPQSATSLQTGLGAKVAAPLKRGSVTVVPQAYATYQHEFANDSRGLNAGLSQGGTTFNFRTEAPQRNFASVGANLTILTGKNFRLQFNYNAEVGRSNFTAHYLNAGLRWEF